jgi:hypothetical protein
MSPVYIAAAIRAVSRIRARHFHSGIFQSQSVISSSLFPLSGIFSAIPPFASFLLQSQPRSRDHFYWGWLGFRFKQSLNVRSCLEIHSLSFATGPVLEWSFYLHKLVAAWIRILLIILLAKSLKSDSQHPVASRNVIGQSICRCMYNGLPEIWGWLLSTLFHQLLGADEISW